MRMLFNSLHDLGRHIAVSKISILRLLIHNTEDILFENNFHYLFFSNNQEKLWSIYQEVKSQE